MRKKLLLTRLRWRRSLGRITRGSVSPSGSRCTISAGGLPIGGEAAEEAQHLYAWAVGLLLITWAYPVTVVSIHMLILGLVISGLLAPSKRSSRLWPPHHVHWQQKPPRPAFQSRGWRSKHAARGQHVGSR